MRHLLFFVLGAALLWIGESVYAHGGAFRGPNGGVPPGLRVPGDPEPPPPPPSDPPGPGGPTTGEGDHDPRGDNVDSAADVITTGRDPHRGESGRADGRDECGAASLY